MTNELAWESSPIRMLNLNHNPGLLGAHGHAQHADANVRGWAKFCTELTCSRVGELQLRQVGMGPRGLSELANKLRYSRSVSFSCLCLTCLVQVRGAKSEPAEPLADSARPVRQLSVWVPAGGVRGRERCSLAISSDPSIRSGSVWLEDSLPRDSACDGKITACAERWLRQGTYAEQHALPRGVFASLFVCLSGCLPVWLSAALS